jgi:hypothetical protein
MAWIESHQQLPRHPKLANLASKLGIHKGMAFWHLHNLWYWALDYASDGHVGKYNSAEIADAADWRGDPVAFWDALKACRWIDPETDNLHDWHDYAGKLCDERERNRDRMREARAAQKLRNVQHTCNTRAENGIGTCGATVPNSTVPNSTVPNPTNTPSAVVIPSSLNTDRFKKAWEEWDKFRREKRQRLTPSTVAKQMAKLEEWGEPKAIQSINNSIAAGWTGLFEPKNGRDENTYIATPPRPFVEDR